MLSNFNSISLVGGSLIERDMDLRTIKPLSAKLFKRADVKSMMENAIADMDKETIRKIKNAIMTRGEAVRSVISKYGEYDDDDDVILEKILKVLDAHHRKQHLDEPLLEKFKSDLRKVKILEGRTMWEWAGSWGSTSLTMAYFVYSLGKKGREARIGRLGKILSDVGRENLQMVLELMENLRQKEGDIGKNAAIARHRCMGSSFKDTSCYSALHDLCEVIPASMRIQDGPNTELLTELLYYLCKKNSPLIHRALP